MLRVSPPEKHRLEHGMLSKYLGHLRRAAFLEELEGIWSEIDHKWMLLVMQKRKDLL